MPFDPNRKLFARSESVNGVDFHAVEPWLLTGMSDGTVNIYNIESGAIISTFDVVPDEIVQCVKFIPRKNWFAAGSTDGEICIFNYNTLEKVVDFEAHPDGISCLAIHQTAPVALTGSYDKTIKAWDWDKQWCIIHVFQGHNLGITNIAFNPKEFDIFVSASKDGTIKMWSIDSPMAKCTIKAHNKGVNYVEFYPGSDKAYLVTASNDNTVKVWDYLSENCVQTLKNDTNPISFAVFHPDLPIIINGSEDGSVNLWHIDTSRVENTLTYELGSACCVALRKGAHEVAVGFDEGVITLVFDHPEPDSSMNHTEPAYTSNDTVLSADLQTLENTTLTSPFDGIPLKTKDLDSTQGPVPSLLYSSDDRFVAVMCGNKYIIYTTLQWHIESSGTGISFAWAPNSNIFAVLETQTSLKIYKNLMDISDHGRKVVGTFVAEELYTGPVLGARGPGYIMFWDWETGKIAGKVEIDAKNIYWFSTGTRITISSSDRLYVFDFDRDVYQDKLDKQGHSLEDERTPKSFTLHSSQGIDDLVTGLTTEINLEIGMIIVEGSESGHPYEVEHYQRCITLAMELVASRDTNKLISELRNNEAQDMVDFLSKMLYDEDTLTMRKRKQILRLLTNLAKSAQVFPRSLELTGVQCDLAKPIAEGGYAFIYKGIHEEHPVCIKAVRGVSGRISRSRLVAHANELIISSYLLHPNVLPFLGIYLSEEDMSRICIVLPWMDNGDLLQYLMEFPDVPRKPIVHDIISGLQYLHDLDIVHADIKAKNVLLSEGGRAMLADFGVSRLSEAETQTPTNFAFGAVYWMAPELFFDDGPPTRASDIWAFACTCYEIITGMTPFSQYRNASVLISAFMRGNIVPLKPTPGIGWNEDVWLVAERCWESDPANRPTAHELLAMINSFNFSDDRPPETQTHRRRRSTEIDYDRISSILDEIRQSTSVESQ